MTALLETSMQLLLAIKLNISIDKFYYLIIQLVQVFFGPVKFYLVW